MEKEQIISLENVLPPSQDFYLLRKEGIRLIERMAGHDWTDYNSHDPGITILEALCYTLTDLGYRTAFDIRDLLTAPGPEEDKAVFFGQAQILPCDALTIIDVRKLVIDTEGVRNAWVETSNQSEIGIYVVREEHGYQLSYDLSDGIASLSLKGLYKVLVEYDDKVILRNTQESVADMIRAKLNAHRGLAEDFLTVSSVEYELFAMEAEVQVNEGADIERINAEIFDMVQSLFSPSVMFYSFDQMFARGYTVEEIFEGPLLKHGFIDSKELEQSSRNNLVHLSTVVNGILRIPGVIAVKKCLFPVGSQSPFSDFTEWMNEAARSEKNLRLDVQRSSILFSRTGDRHRTDKEKQPDRSKVQAIYAFLRSEKKSARLKDFSPVRVRPPGEYMDVAAYHPFQYSLPAAYGLQEQVLPGTSNSDSRSLQGSLRNLPSFKKKVLQLKGFLLVFEQIMSDYLLQLSNFRNLLSIHDTTARTSPSQPLSGIPDFEWLFTDFTAYHTKLNSLAENDKEWGRKKDRILNHLLARVGEDLDRYSAYIRNQAPGGEGEIIAAKSKFLQSYTEISSYRGTAFNNADPMHVWDSANVPGIKKRICRLLGIEDFRTRHLSSSLVAVARHSHANDLTRWVVVVKDPEDEEKILLESNEYASESEIRSILDHFLQKGFDKRNYDVNTNPEKFSYRLMRLNQEDETEPIATTSFKTKTELDKYFEKLIDTLSGFARNEGFHLVEHILLRPRIDAQEPQGAEDTSSITLMSAANPAPAFFNEESVDAVRPFRFRVNKTKGSGTAAKVLNQLTLINEKKAEVLIVQEDFIFSRDVTERIESIRNLGADRSSYEESLNADGYSLFTIKDKERPLAKSARAYRHKGDMDAEILNLIDFFSYEVKLRAEAGQHGTSIAEYIDPYSLQVSFFFPDWPIRFRDPAFRHLIEKTVYLETPAHIFPYVYWLDYYQMDAFEKVYRPWLENLAANNIPDAALQNNLVQFINSLNTAAHEEQHH